MADHGHKKQFEGPLCWAASTIAGALVGFLVAKLAPAVYEAGHPIVPLWLVAPFALLLLSIAVMPFISTHFWHHHFPDISFFLGALVAVYYMVAYGAADATGHSYGLHTLGHTLIEYYSFIALIGSLYVASGGVVIDTRGRATPSWNTGLLAIGAVLANVIGTTGASVLLIRPFIRSNRGRIRPLHVVFFIFIISNCGGALTPIGDPPLFLGYLKGVPFAWTLVNLWKPWLLVVGILLAMFYVYDRRVGPGTPPEIPDDASTHHHGLRIRGATGVAALAVIVAAIFIDPLLSRRFGVSLAVPIGPVVQIAVAIAAYIIADKANHAANGFSLFPVKEVGLLFVGIFLTMMPALSYLSHHAPAWNITSPTAYYFLTGVLSAGLDNAPTYLSFLQVAFGDQAINPESVAMFLAMPQGPQILEAVSLGAVFFGAMSYIGNGPNFMVRSIAQASEVRMPSFFGYIGLACAILLPVLVVAWAVFIR